VKYTSEEQKSLVSEILDSCCKELMSFFEKEKHPSKIELKKSLVSCMDHLTIAPIDQENREFGYQLGWYLSEKANVDLKKGTEKKVWGYWQVDGNEVKPPIKPKISSKVRMKQKYKEEQAEGSII
jgi:hypothetical protein